MKSLQRRRLCSVLSWKTFSRWGERYRKIIVPSLRQWNSTSKCPSCLLKEGNCWRQKTPEFESYKIIDLRVLISYADHSPHEYLWPPLSCRPCSLSSTLLSRFLPIWERIQPVPLSGSLSKLLSPISSSPPMSRVSLCGTWSQKNKTKVQMASNISDYVFK